MATESQAVEDESRDITTETRMILSAVAHMDGEWGMDIVAKVVCGSNSKRVIEPGLDELSVYGVLDDLSQRAVRRMLKCMVKRRLIGRLFDKRLRLRSLGVAVMKGNARLSEEMKKMLRERRDKKIRRDPAERYPPDSETIQKTLRLLLEGVHPRVIAKRRELSESTISKHALTLAAQGNTFDLTPHLDGDLLGEVREKAAGWKPGDPMTPVRESLREDCDWPKLELHLIQMWMDEKHQSGSSD